VADLRASLRAAGSELVVRVGRPEEVVAELVRRTGAATVYCHTEVGGARAARGGWTGEPGRAAPPCCLSRVWRVGWPPCWRCKVQAVWGPFRQVPTLPGRLPQCPATGWLTRLPNAAAPWRR
jgi:hypothetical protein